MASESSKMSQETKTIIVILLLVFFYPLGLIFMWLWMKEWPTWAKLLISLPVALGILMVVLAITGMIFWVPFWHLSGRYPDGPNVSTNLPVSTQQSLQEATFSTQISTDEQKQMYQAARDYIKKNSDPKLTFDMDLKKIYNQYALLQVIPLNQEIDQAQVIMEKKNGVWTPQTFGTSFPEWYQKVPQLFN